MVRHWPTAMDCATVVETCLLGGEEKLQERQHVVAGQVAAGDALVVVLLGAAAFSTSASRPLLARPLTDFLLLTVGVGVVGVVVAWRAYRFNVALLAGKARWFRPIVEGFILGFSLSFFSLLGFAADTALAAGMPYDGAEEWGLGEWLQYAVSAAGVSLYPAALGAVLGATLSVVNRGLLKVAGEHR